MKHSNNVKLFSMGCKNFKCKFIIDAVKQILNHSCFLTFGKTFDGLESVMLSFLLHASKIVLLVTDCSKTIKCNSLFKNNQMTKAALIATLCTTVGKFHAQISMNFVHVVCMRQMIVAKQSHGRA